MQDQGRSSSMGVVDSDDKHCWDRFLQDRLLVESSIRLVEQSHKENVAWWDRN